MPESNFNWKTCENGAVLRHRVERLEEEMSKHDSELNDLQRCVIKLTTLEEKSERRSSQMFASVLAIIAGVVVAGVAAYLGFKG